MPVVTSGLLGYWNAKDGVTAGALKNIAPGGIVLPAALELGAYYDAATQSIFLDGTDDRIAIANNAMFTGATAFTFEYVYTTRSVHTSGYRLLVGGSAYADVDQDVNGIYLQLMEGTSRRPFEAVSSAIDTAQKMHLVIQYDDAANLVRVYINGVQVLNVTNETRVLKFSLAGTTPVYFNYSSGSYTYLPINFHAVRMYNRVLSAAEVADNFANGTEIGLSVPQVKIAEHRVQNPNGTTTNIPVYQFTGVEADPLRVKTTDGVGYIPLVLTTDPLASRIRIQTHLGLRALKK